jgi:serine/threonine protein kinase
VWRATEKGESGRRVAIKQVQVHPLEKDMAYREVENLEKVENDHIIKYYTSIYDNSESTLNLIMELGSASLRTQIALKTYSRAELLSFIAQMTSAFLELLEKKLMHLDLKP